MTQEIIGIIGGTGLGDSLAKHIHRPRFKKVATPFGKPSCEIMTGCIGTRQVAFINRHGDGHKLDPSRVPYAANIFALKKLGVHTVIATGAVGSLRQKIAPGNLVIVDQFIDKTFRRQSSFFNEYGAVHCEMAHPVCPHLVGCIAQASKRTNMKVHRGGTYVCMEGPQFSTRAESLMHQKWGGDLIGMTAMPEAKLAREAQMCYTLIALVSDYDCWRENRGEKDKQTLIKEIMGNLGRATANCLKLIEAVLASNVCLAAEDCHCRKALELAVWTQPAAISAQEKRKLAVLFE